MFEEIINTINLTAQILIILSIVLLSFHIFNFVYGFTKPRKFKDAKINHRYAIFIPARDESKVIRGILDSLKNQDYPHELYDIYVIVESKFDETINICKEYENVNVFVRPNLKVKRKGAALDQLVKYLLKNDIPSKKGYEAYFIFDADNKVDSNFLTEMNKTFDQGYDIAMGYRNASNWNDSWVSSCSALTFSAVNTFQSKSKARFFNTIVVSGTGYYIRASIINELKGWPFQSLTEDAEISSFATLNNLKAAYNENTQYYDEQPISAKVSFTQRMRWVKGHGEVSKIYTSKLLKSAFTSKSNRFIKFMSALGMVPIIVPVFTVIFNILSMLILALIGRLTYQPALLINLALRNAFGWAISAYTFLALWTLLMLIGERKRINLTFTNAVKTVLLNPIFTAMYVPIFICGLFRKVEWTAIPRKVDLEEVELNEENTEKVEKEEGLKNKE